MRHACRAQCGCQTVRLEAQLYAERTKRAILVEALKQVVKEYVRGGITGRVHRTLLEALERVEEIAYDG